MLHWKNLADGKLNSISSYGVVCFSLGFSHAGHLARNVGAPSYKLVIVIRDCRFSAFTYLCDKKQRCITLRNENLLC